MSETASSAAALLASANFEAPSAEGLPEYLTVKQIAAKTHSSEAFWYKEIEQGRLEADRFGTLVRISPAQFEAYRARQSKKITSSEAA
jgi:excisionase family DNA binding protein